MENIEQGNNDLRKEGVPSSEDIQNALKAQQEVLDTITHEAEKMLSAFGGDYDVAINDALSEGRTDIAEKLEVMKKIAEMGK